MCSEINYIQVREIISRGLHEFLDGVQVRLNLVGDAIYNSFFALQPAPIAAQARTGSEA
jgi:uncharacterized alpha-E superfamily protein